MHSIGSLEVFTTKTGVLSAKHAVRGVLIHSAVDPVSEARTIATQYILSGVKSVVIIGCGMGYLERELSAHDIEVVGVEVLPEMWRLRAELSKSLQHDHTKSPVYCADAETMRSYLRTSFKRAVYVAPYVLSLVDKLPSDVAAEILSAHVMSSSRALYQPLIAANERRNADAIGRLPRVVLRGTKSNKIAVAVGAGPTLNRCIDTFRRERKSVLLIAASGAVPTLDDHGIVPDWTIALEARDSLSRDVERLPDTAKVVAFPWSDPDLFRNDRLSIFLADDASGLVTNGGTSGLTAADFAYKITRANVYLVGMDLTNVNSDYAVGAARTSSATQIASPKFSVMRRAIEEWSRDHREHRVYHVITPGVSPLAGLRPVTPALFAADLRDASERQRKLSAHDYV